MGQQPSKDHLLYQYASSGNVDKIKTRRAQGAKLEVMHPYFPFNTRASVVPASRPSPAEDVELAMAINASIQFDMESRPPYADANPISGASTSSNCQSGSMRNHNEIQEGCQSGLMLNQYACSGNVDKIKPVRAKGAKLEVRHPYFPFNTRASVVAASRPSPVEDVELAMAINASIQSAMESRPPYVDANPISGASTSSSCQSGSMRNHNEIQQVGLRGNPIQLIRNHNETPSSPLPSGPPIENVVVDGCASSLCLICLDAPVEGACIPCGHMVGCMSCLNEIKGKKWSCPVCRTKITEVMRIYTV